MKRLIILLLLIVFVNSHLFAQDDEPPYGGMYMGFKVGLPYLVGLDLGYVMADEERFRGYFNMSAQTIVVFSSFNYGAGYFIGKKGIALGLRLNHFAHVDLGLFTDSDTITGTLLTPEVSWFKNVGKRKNTIISLQLSGAGLNFSLGGLLF